MNNRAESLLKYQFGLKYLLDGSVQRTDTKLRVALQLLDLRTNNRIVWTRRFDRETNDLFALQDEIGAEVVA